MAFYYVLCYGFYQTYCDVNSSKTGPVLFCDCIYPSSTDPGVLSSVNICRMK